MTDLAKVQRAINVLSFGKSPLTAEMVSNASKSSGVPVDFILTAGTLESHLGTAGRAVPTKNAFNLGNTDCGDYKPAVRNSCNSFKNDWESGLNAFTSLIRNCYFDEGEKITLETYIARDFRAVRCSVKGSRYMTDRMAKSKYLAKIGEVRKLLS